MEALLQIHFFSHSIKLRALSLSTVTLSVSRCITCQDACVQPFKLSHAHRNPSITHSLIWCFVWRDGGRTQWLFVSFEHPLVHEERCWRELPTHWHRRFLKRTESQLCWTIHRQQVDCQIVKLRWFFIRLDQLNSSMQGKGKILLDVSETTCRLNIRPGA